MDQSSAANVVPSSGSGDAAASIRRAASQGRRRLSAATTPSPSPGKSARTTAPTAAAAAASPGSTNASRSSSMPGQAAPSVNDDDADAEMNADNNNNDDNGDNGEHAAEAAFPHQHYHLHEYKRRPMRREPAFSAALEEAKQRAEQKRAADIDIQEQLQDLAGQPNNPDVARDARALLIALCLGKDLAARVARPISDALLMPKLQQRVDELREQLRTDALLAEPPLTAARPHVSTGARSHHRRRGRDRVPDPDEAGNDDTKSNDAAEEDAPAAAAADGDDDGGEARESRRERRDRHSRRRERRRDRSASPVRAVSSASSPPPPGPPAGSPPPSLLPPPRAAVAPVLDVAALLDIAPRQENIRALFGPGSNRFRGPTPATINNDRNERVYQQTYRRIVDEQFVAPASQFRTPTDVNHDEYMRTLFQWVVDARYLAALDYVLACIRSSKNKITSKLTIQELLQPPFRAFLLEWTAAQFQITMGRSQAPWPNKFALQLLCAQTLRMQKFFDSYRPGS